MPTIEEIKKQIELLGDIDTYGTAKEIASLPEVLRDKELVKGLTSGFHDGNTWLIVCTDLRLIFLDKGFIFGLTQVDIPLDKVNSIAHDTGFIFASIAVWDGASKILIENVDKTSAKKFVGLVHDALKAYKESQKPIFVQSVTPVEDISSKLIKLADLKSKGILTEDEFLDQKKKLLAS